MYDSNSEVIHLESSGAKIWAQVHLEVKPVLFSISRAYLLGTVINEEWLQPQLPHPPSFLCHFNVIYFYFLCNSYTGIRVSPSPKLKKLRNRCGSYFPYPENQINTQQEASHRRKCWFWLIIWGGSPLPWDRKQKGSWWPWWQELEADSWHLGGPGARSEL